MEARTERWRDGRSDGGKAGAMEGMTERWREGRSGAACPEAGPHVRGQKTCRQIEHTPTHTHIMTHIPPGFWADGGHIESK